MATLPGPCRLLSWAPWRPGFVTASRVVWREVRNADLGPEVDALALLETGLAGIGALDAVGLMTSRDIRRHFLATADVEGVMASCLATVGLGNGERVGHRRHARPAGFGTVNMLVHVSAGLDDTALLEASSIAGQARTVAILAGGYRPAGVPGPVSGTGTDCVAIATPEGGRTLRYAGLHTAVGEAIGQAVLEAVGQGVADWLAEQAALRSANGSGG